MGNNTWNLNGGDFEIKAEKVNAATSALYELAGRLGLAEPEKFADSDQPSDFERFEIELSRFECECSMDESTGNVAMFWLSTERPDTLTLDGRSECSELWAAEAMAPFLTPGSWVAFECCGDAWALVFDGVGVRVADLVPDGLNDDELGRDWLEGKAILEEGGAS